MTIGSLSSTIEAVNENMNMPSLGASKTAISIKSGWGKAVGWLSVPGGSLIGFEGLNEKDVFHGWSTGFPCPQLYFKIHGHYLY